MRIHKVLSRGEGTDAQVLLVLVSAPESLAPDLDVWVAIGRSEPASIPAAAGWESIEPCRTLTAAELEALDLSWKPGQRPFDLDDHTVPRRHWLARFDFTDHPYVRGLWFRLAKHEHSPGTLDVIAWRSHLVRKPDESGVERDYFTPLPGHASRTIPVSEVVPQPLFELGVLFVHGIGNHGVRETLVRWAEPIVRIWRERGFVVEKQARAAIPEVERHRVKRWVLALQLRNRAPIDGISQVVDDFAMPADGTEAQKPLVRPASAMPVTCCSAIRAEETLFADVAPGQPSCALLRVSTVDTNATLRESHVLFAEAYWTREAFPPTRSELYDWLTTAIPIAVWARAQHLVAVRPLEIIASDRRAGGLFEWFRLAVSGVLWMMQVIVLPAAYVIGGIAGQIVLGLISLVGVLPIPWLQRATRAVVTALLGTLGQSFALQTSAIRRSAIVSSVTKNLNWLSERCHRVVVLSHSQGAEISRLAFLDSRRENVARWFTAGSGIAPLSMLHPRSLDAHLSRRVVVASKLVLGALMALVAALAVDMTPGVQLGIGASLSQWLQRLGWQTWVAADLAFLAVVVVLRPKGPEVRTLLRASLLAKWRDIYASEDPVPGGSLIDRFEKELRRRHLPVPSQRRIFNTRIAFLDHTTYFRNVEQFVAPVALDLLQLLGAGGDKAREQVALDQAGRRRDLRTWWNMLVSVLGLLTSAALIAWVAVGPAQRGAAWIEEARLIWAQGSGVWELVGLWWSTGLLGRVLMDVKLSFVVLLALAGWWALCNTMSRRSESILLSDLARAARSAAPSTRSTLD